MAEGDASEAGEEEEEMPRYAEDYFKERKKDEEEYLRVRSPLPSTPHPQSFGLGQEQEAAQIPRPPVEAGDEEVVVGPGTPDAAPAPAPPSLSPEEARAAQLFEEAESLLPKEK